MVFYTTKKIMENILNETERKEQFLTEEQKNIIEEEINEVLDNLL